MVPISKFLLFLSLLSPLVPLLFFTYIFPHGTGFPRLSSTGTLSVLLQDENDNAPNFSQDKYNFKIKENNDPGEHENIEIETKSKVQISV